MTMRLDLPKRALATALPLLAMCGCILAEPRPDPWGGNGGGGGRESGGAPFGATSGFAANDNSGVDPDDVSASSGSYFAVSGGSAERAPVAVLGFAGATYASAEGGNLAGPAGIEVVNVSGGRALTFADGTGAFALTVEAAAGDLLVVRLLVPQSDGTIESSQGEVLVVPNAAGAGVGGGGGEASGVSASGPDADGVVTVNGAPGASGGNVPVAAGNLGNASSAAGVSGADGSFSLSLLGASGDRIVVFAASSLDPTSTSALVELVVP